MKVAQWLRRFRIWILVGLALWLIVGVWRPWSPHHKISLDQVESVEVKPKNGSAYALPPFETGLVVSWFNSVSEIENMPGHAGPGCGSYSRIDIALKSGEEIVIWGERGGRVNRYPAVRQGGVYKDYYVKQADLKAYFEKLDSMGEGTGC